MSDINAYTAAEIAALTPLSGDLVLNTDDNAVQLWNGSAWKIFSSDVSPFQNEYSLSFDGAGDYVSTGLDVGGASALTFSAWVKHDDLQDTSPNLVNQYESASPSYKRALRFSMYANTSSWAGLLCSLYTSDGTKEANYLLNPIISTGTWYHTAFVFDGTSVKVYYNGDNSQASATTTWSDSATLNTGGVEVLLGGGAGVSKYLKGNLDEVGIWTSALSADDITAIYNDGNGPTNISTIGNSGNGPDAWYRMEEGSGGSVVNTANPGPTDGTINGATFVSGDGNIPG